MSESLSDLLGLISSGLAKPEPNNLQYQPHTKQTYFHCSAKKGRLFIGGNRSGKTVAGINEAVWWLTGRHPYIALPPPPIYGRLVTVDFKNGAEKIIIPQLKQWFVASDLINGSWDDSFNKNLMVLTLANGSQLEIMSYDQELEKFAGVPRHFIYFDEEPPKDIYQECISRLTDYNGRWWMCMTPVGGFTWTYDTLYEEGVTPYLDIVEVAVSENPNISQDAINATMSMYTPDERRMRERGEYVSISGLVFKHFNPDIHVIPGKIPPSSWTHYMSLDAGFNNPTACYWHAVEPGSGRVVTYKEHYKSEWTTQQHAEFIVQENKILEEQHGIKIFLQIADPAIKQRQQTTGQSIQIEYSKHGVHFATGVQRDINAGLDKMNNYMRLNKWYITDACPAMIRELRKYKYGEFASSRLREKNNPKDKPQKKDDHAIDSTRYFYSYMPELDITANSPKPQTYRLPDLHGAGQPRRILAPDLAIDYWALQQVSQPSYMDETTGIY